MKPTNDLLRLSVEQYTETPTGFALDCAHPNASEAIEKVVTWDEIGNHLIVDGQGNVAVWSGNPDEDADLIPLEQYVSDMGMMRKAEMLGEVINAKEGRTKWVKKALPDAAMFRSPNPLAAILSQIKTQKAA